MADERRGETGETAGSRDVVVPLRVYKAVTVFSTFIAAAAVVGGFVLVDQATDRATAPVEDIQPLVAVAGIALVLGGAGTYAFSTRFRTAEMGKSKDEADELSDDG